MARITRVEVPSEIQTLAVPASWLSYFVSQRDNNFILVIKKRPPTSTEYYCGERHRFSFQLDMLPRGGILLEFKGLLRNESNIISYKYLLMRTLKHATIEVRGSAWDFKDEADEEALKNKAFRNLFEEPQIIARGYLVFERMNEKEWKITRKDPEAYVYVKSYSMSSRSGNAEYKILRTVNAYTAVTDYTACSIDSEAAMLLILPTNKPAYVEYKYWECPYRGDCEEVTESVEITWNNGNPTARETTFPGEDIEVI